MGTHSYLDIATTVGYESEPAKAPGIALAVFLGLASLFGAAGNGLTILAVVIDRKLRSQSSSFLIANLAVADMVVFVVIEPFLAFSTATTTWPFSRPLCAALGALVIQHMAVAVCGMTAVAVNRYYSVVKRTSYQRVFTRRKTLVVCLATWLPGLLLILPLVTNPFFADYSTYFGICIITSQNIAIGRAISVLTGLLILIGIVISLLCYLRIYKEVKDSRRRVKSLEPLPDDTRLPGGQHQPPGSHENNISRKPNPKQQINQTEIAISLNLFMVFTVFCVCWTPITVLIFVLDANDRHFHDQSDLIPDWAWQTAYKMVLFNSSFNIFIYAWRNRNFRSAYAKLLRCPSR
ncbi:melatonin receptor type 1B-B-like [Acanthaster planci]|uniref:Melatonin receptor type 1B-B-like n=1 Tax=Acanthaster planci TaxID=133434 RepID=A0A8B7ZKH0_ACAPL|nr:melatonin receptor type 1B-B-like [Acanthaster planci]